MPVPITPSRRRPVEAAGGSDVGLLAKRPHSERAGAKAVAASTPAVVLAPIEAAGVLPGAIDVDSSAPGALLPGVPDESGGGQRPRYRLTWEGRWGKWGGVDCVLVVAPLVATLEVSIPNGDVPPGEVVDELRSKLAAELQEEPPSRVLVAVREEDAPAKDPSGKQRRDVRTMKVKAALVWKKSRCQKLAATWKERKLCNGRAVVTWASTSDTADTAHVDKVKAEDAQSVRSSAVALQLPRSWAFRTLPAGNGVPLAPSSHWHQFAAVFGTVDSVELVWGSQLDDVVHLLMRFKVSQNAKAFVEMLASRYLWNPMTGGAQRKGDGYPVVYAADSLANLRARVVGEAVAPLSAPAGESQAAGPPAQKAATVGEQIPEAQLEPAPAGSPKGPVFRLTRMNAGPMVQTAELKLVPWKKNAVLGREDECALVVRSHHVSRQHALLSLMPTVPTHATEGEAMGLFIQDKSTNGVWINGRRMAKDSLVQLRDRDVITLEAEGIVDIPTYLVRSFRDLAQASEASPTEARGPLHKELAALSAACKS